MAKQRDCDNGFDDDTNDSRNNSLRRHGDERDDDFHDRRQYHELSERQMDRLAEKIAKLAAPIAKQLVIDEFAMTIGKSVVAKIAWIIGITFIALATWLATKGYIKP